MSTNDPNQPPRSLWDKVLSAIPVVMTVVATLLAGLSSSEMTQAQYHRSLAAQHQSKVGDQWNFFQAKRQRATILAAQIDALRAELAGAGETNYVLCATRLEQELERAANGITPSSVAPIKPLDKSIEHAKGLAEQLLKIAPPEKLVEQRAELKDPRQALRSHVEAIVADLPAVLDAIEQRQPEHEIAARLAGISTEEVSRAIERVETLAAELDATTREPVQRLEQLNDKVIERVDHLRPVFAAVPKLESALEDAEKETAEQRSAIARTLRPLRRAAAAATELVRAAQLARNEYNERRYECESRYNQVIAGLYEVQVRKSGLTAEQHRRRSYMFFYAMLIAQGGVTLATLALAIRQMSALWGLATLAGLAAMAAGVYVYWFM
jgi:hypothetical protein